ncbi:MAG: hypothetical protein OEW68_00060 [Gammaproteobacteria bacterium]|nr:hypothetical protein [Gammaproteobacteria bacterium]MDH4313217.1 hypothetical protein [Gammaproteobacteria bacterium]MDH5213577.1 hypothetical protein [Gammaproteobacteria bacterium]
MNTRTDSPTSVKTAISEVLGAEQDVLAQLAACESRAAQMLGDARQAVRAMVRRIQQRISRVHAGCAEKTRVLIDRMERDAASVDTCEIPADGERQILQDAVCAVAQDLTTKDRSNGD